MSVQAMSWVLDFSASRLGARLVLLAIANYVSNDDGEAWPSVETIAEKSGLERSNVFRNLQELERIGELKIVTGGKGPKDTNTYQMPLFLDWYLRVAKGGEKRVAKGSENTSKGSENTEKGSQSATRTVRNHQEPSVSQPSVETVETEEGSPSKERENPQASYRAAKSIYRRYCKGNLGNLGEKQGEAWSSLLGQYGEKKVLGALEIWARELREPKKWDYPIALFLKDPDEFIEAYELAEAPAPEEEPESDGMLTAKDVIREREERERESRGR